MFYSLLVPLDGTPQAAAALPLARSVAVATGGALTLLRVVSPHHPLATNTAHSYLLPIAEELHEAGPSVRVCVRQGEPAAEIVRTARDGNHDLIVMASHAHGSRSIAALTSVSRRVLTSSPAPVLMVRPGGIRTSRIRTLLVPVDGSPGASLALGVALAMTHATGARIVLLDVVVPLAASAFSDLPGMTQGGYIDPAWERLATTTARSYVEELAAQVARTGADVEPRLATGEVAAEIERCADDVNADMVVMSTHSLVWPLQAYLGSVADAVLRDGRRPVLLIRREAPVGDTAAVELATV